MGHYRWRRSKDCCFEHFYSRSHALEAGLQASGFDRRTTEARCRMSGTERGLRVASDIQTDTESGMVTGSDVVMAPDMVTEYDP